MTKNILLWLMLLAPFISSAQIVTILDTESGLPLQMVTLVSEEPPVNATTNANGQADISSFAGSRAITIRMLGYEPVIMSFDELATAKFRLKLAPSAISLGGVVISSTRDRSSLAGPAGAKITSINPKTVQLQQPQTAADLLRFSGKVFIQKSQQGGGSPMIRGFSTNRLLYTVDGIRMNTAIFRGGNLQNVISLDPFALEATDIFFGPGSIIFGSDAIGGVMSFTTLTPQLSLTDKPLVTGKVVARTATANNEMTGHFDVNVGWKKLAFLTSISANNYGDLRMGENGPDDYLSKYYVVERNDTDVVMLNPDPLVQRPTGYKQVNMMQKVRFKPNNRWDFQYGFHYSETSPYSRYDRHLRLRNGLPRYATWNYGPQIWMMNNINITHNRVSAVYDEMTIRMGWQKFEESRISRNLNTTLRETQVEKVDAYSLNVDLIKRTGKRNNLYYGVEGVINEVYSTGYGEDIHSGAVLPGPSRYPRATWSSYGAYLTDHFYVHEKVELQAGVRYNLFAIDAAFDTTFYPFPFTDVQIQNDAVTGSAGIVYRPSEKWVIAANAATGFRTPNIDDMGKVFDSEPGSVVIPNPNLEPEYVYNADLNISKRFGSVLKLDMAVYYTVLENALVRRDYQLNGMDSIVYDGVLSQVQAIQNAAVATVYGVQAGFELKLPKGFSLASDFNYQHGEEELDDGIVSPSRHAPPWFGNTRLTWSNQKLRLQFYSDYSGEMTFAEMPEEEKGKPELYASDNNGKPYSPGWYTLNFKGSYQLTEKFAVTGGLENITSQRYRPYSSGLTAAGRNFLLSLRLKF